MTTTARKRLEVRTAVPSDVRAILRLIARVYPGLPNYSPATVRGQINNFPDGCFVALYDNKVVGYCATMRVSKSMLTWSASRVMIESTCRPYSTFPTVEMWIPKNSTCTIPSSSG